jgi:hypothetical protein
MGTIHSQKLGGSKWVFQSPICLQADIWDAASALLTARLSSQGLERAASITETDFVLIWNSCTLQCARFEATFISPRVHSFLKVDNLKGVDVLFLE